MSETSVSQLQLGVSYDLQEDAFDCAIETMPATAVSLFEFNCETGELLVDEAELLELKSEKDTIVILKIVMTDKNPVLPAESNYQMTFLVAADYVPTTEEEGDESESSEESESSFDFLGTKFETEDVEIRREVRFVLMQIDNQGVASIIFSEPLNLLSNLTLIDESVLDLKLVPQSDFPSSKLEFSWSVKEFKSTQIDLQVKFASPLYISAEGPDSRDTLVVRALEDAPLYFVAQQSTNKVRTILKSDETVQAEIPAQLAGSAEEIAALKEQAESAGQASSIGIGGGFVVNLLFASSLQMLWGLVNTLQVLTALVFMRVYVPENAMLVNMALLDSANLNILPMEAVFEVIFPWLFADAKPEATDSIIGSPIEEIGNFLVIIIGILSMIPLIWVYKILNKGKKSKEVSQFVFYSGSLQLYMESYLQIVLSCLIVFRAGLDSETGSQIFRSVFVCTALLGCFLIPGLVSAYLQINRGRFR